jgi:quinol-cytochrome oxidoreductase complex cytochrome b subunit
LSENQRKSEPFFPDFMLKDLMGWVLIINFLAIVVAFFPMPVGQPGNPFAPTPPGIKPEWYFLSIYQYLKLWPSKIGGIEGEQVALMTALVIPLSLILVPFFDTGKSKIKSNFATWYGIILLLVLVVLSIWGHFS